LTGLAERQRHRIISELVVAGHIDVERVGCRNMYSVKGDEMLGFPFEADMSPLRAAGTLAAAEERPFRRGLSKLRSPNPPAHHSNPGLMEAVHS
jgi:hypothetical protein